MPVRLTTEDIASGTLYRAHGPADGVAFANFNSVLASDAALSPSFSALGAALTALGSDIEPLAADMSASGIVKALPAPVKKRMPAVFRLAHKATLNAKHQRLEILASFSEPPKPKDATEEGLRAEDRAAFYTMQPVKLFEKLIKAELPLLAAAAEAGRDRLGIPADLYARVEDRMRVKFVAAREQLKAPRSPSMEDVAPIGNDDAASEREAEKIVDGAKKRGEVIEAAEQALKTTVTLIAVLLQISNEEALAMLLA